MFERLNTLEPFLYRPTVCCTRGRRMEEASEPRERPGHFHYCFDPRGQAALAAGELAISRLSIIGRDLFAQS